MIQVQPLGGVEYAAALIGSALVVGLATPVVRSLALRKAIVDAPDGAGGRKTQAAPVPYLGGVALALAVTLSILAAIVLLKPSNSELTLALGVLIPGLALGAVGLIDDLKGLGPLPRFMAQSLAAVLTAGLSIVGGTSSQLTGFPVFDVIITIVWIVGITNALNLMDNMDGLSGTVAGIAATFFGLIAATNGQYLIAALSFALAGSCMGFLFHNWRPAKIYMGDAGALFLGFILAVIGIRIDLASQPLALSLAVPVLVLALPILDTTLVVIDRRRRGLSPFQGGRDHLSHRIHRIGYSVPQTVRMIGALGVLSGGTAFVLSRTDLVAGLVILGITAGLFVLVFVRALKIPASDTSTSV